jgi:hypothetical protein
VDIGAYEFIPTGIGLGRDVVTWGWGYGEWTECTPPPNLTNAIAVAAGAYQNLALRADGSVVAWGTHGEEIDREITAALTNVVAVAAGGTHSVALRADGTVVAWGHNWNGQTNVPPGLASVGGIAGGDTYSLALIGSGPPVVKAPLLGPTRSADGFSVFLSTQSGRVYALEYKNTLDDAVWTPLPLVAGTGHERTLTDPTATGAQRFYRVRRW